MTNPWAAPDRSGATPPLASGPLAPYGEAPSHRNGPFLRSSLLVGLVIAAGVVLLAAPVGLLWSALAPHADVAVFAKDSARFAMPEQEDFIGSDATFLAITAVVGIGCGLLSWRFARRWGPAVVLALAVAALGAAFAAAEVGALVGRSDFRAAVADGARTDLEANVRLMAKEATVGWPVGALLGFLVPLAYRRE